MRLTTALRTTIARALGQCAAVTARWAERLATPPPPAPAAGIPTSESAPTGGPPAHWVEKVRLAAPHLLEPAPPITPPQRGPTPQQPTPPTSTPPDRGTERMRVPYHPEPASSSAVFPAESASEGVAAPRATNDAPEVRVATSGARPVGNTALPADPIRDERAPEAVVPVARADSSHPDSPVQREVVRMTLPLRRFPRERPARPPGTAPQSGEDVAIPIRETIHTQADEPGMDTAVPHVAAVARDTPPRALRGDAAEIPAERASPAPPTVAPAEPESPRLEPLAPRSVAPFPSPREPTVNISERRPIMVAQARPAFPDLAPEWPRVRAMAPSPVAWETPRNPPVPLRGQDVPLEDYWPELPDAPQAARQDPHLLLREWERARRLEREQRGN